jgi:hypothetical protein
MTPRAGIPALLFLWSATLASGGLYSNAFSPGNVPWQGGVVPCVFNAGLSEAIHLYGTGGTMPVTLPAPGPRRFFRVIAGP